MYVCVYSTVDHCQTAVYSITLLSQVLKIVTSDTHVYNLKSGMATMLAFL